MKNIKFLLIQPKEALHDIRYLLYGLGIEQPIVDVELVDDASIQCANCIDSSDG